MIPDSCRTMRKDASPTLENLRFASFLVASTMGRAWYRIAGVSPHPYIRHFSAICAVPMGH